MLSPTGEYIPNNSAEAQLAQLQKNLQFALKKQAQGQDVSALIERYEKKIESLMKLIGAN